MSFGTPKRVQPVLLAVLLFIAPTFAHADLVDTAQKEIAAKNALAKDLIKLGKSISVKEARYPESKGGGGKDFDANTGNPFTSNTTYHSYVWDYCLQWAGNKNCEKWLDPYISEHGFQSAGEDKSPLEDTVASLWKQMKKDGDQGEGGKYGIWDIQKQGGGSLLDDQGKLDRRQITRWELQQPVKKVVEDIGADTAQRQISLSFNEDAPKNTMPNMEALRLMAGRYTRMFRNRMVANLGELRANDKGIEFTLGEDVPDCSVYLDALKANQEKTRTQDRIEPQAELDPETLGLTVEQRYQMCMQVRNASVYMVNAKMDAGKLTQGSPEDEQVDKWRSRVNIATIDFGGIDPNSVPKPSSVQLTEDEVKQKIGDWEDGGLMMKEQKVSNAEQIAAYNRELQKASVAMKEAAARSPFIPDASEQILKNQIAVGSTSLVELNGLTKEMKSELKGTDMPRVSGGQQGNPDRDLEQAPSQITLTAAK